MNTSICAKTSVPLALPSTAFQAGFCQNHSLHLPRTYHKVIVPQEFSFQYLWATGRDHHAGWIWPQVLFSWLEPLPLSSLFYTDWQCLAFEQIQRHLEDTSSGEWFQQVVYQQIFVLENSAQLLATVFHQARLGTEKSLWIHSISHLCCRNK